MFAYLNMVFIVKQGGEGPSSRPEGGGGGLHRSLLQHQHRGCAKGPLK